jgi:hypothetical protein
MAAPPDEDEPKEQRQLFARVRDTPEAIALAIERERHEGWTLKKLEGATPPERTDSLKELINESYTPLNGSDVTPELLVEIIGQSEGSVRGCYLHASDGSVKSYAIAHFRTGITGFLFVYDTAAEEVLRTFKVPLERVPEIGRNAISTVEIQRLVLNVKMLQVEGAINSKKQEQRDAEKTLERVRSEIEQLERARQALMTNTGTQGVP